MKGDIEMAEQNIPNSKKFKDELAQVGMTREDAKQNNITTIEEIKEKRGITGNVKIRKKSSATKIKDIFLPGDTVKVKNFVLKDVIIPTIIKAIDTIVTEGVHMMLYGETDKRRNSTPSNSVEWRSHYDYSSKSRSSSARPYRSSLSRETYEYDDIIFETRGEAENVLMGLDAMLDKYSIVTVADYYELVQVSCNHTARNYGWSDLRSAYIARTRGGYMIKLPKPLPID